MGSSNLNDKLSDNHSHLSHKLAGGHMMFDESKRFAQMLDMKIPHFDNAEDYCFFEPKPKDQMDETTLEGCLYHAAKVESLVDKNNLYHCEQCTEDKFGKSKSKYL